MVYKAFSDSFFRELRNVRKKKILFFNGCFDIVHLGHVKMINEIISKQERNGYYIVCGLNSDLSVSKQNKSHPLINSENSRADMLIELGVDCVFIFDEATPKELLMYLMPDLVYKGNEYEKIDYSEKEFLKAINCKVEYFNTIGGYSTSSIYNKMAVHVKDEIRRSI